MVLKNGFIRRRAEEVRSASHDVTGIVHSNLNKVEHWGRVRCHSDLKLLLGCLVIDLAHSVEICASNSAVQFAMKEDMANQFRTTSDARFITFSC